MFSQKLIKQLPSENTGRQELRAKETSEGPSEPQVPLDGSHGQRKTASSR